MPLSNSVSVYGKRTFFLRGFLRTTKVSSLTSIVTLTPLPNLAKLLMGFVILSPRLFPQGWMIASNFAAPATGYSLKQRYYIVYTYAIDYVVISSSRRCGSKDQAVFDGRDGFDSFLPEK